MTDQAARAAGARSRARGRWSSGLPVSPIVVVPAALVAVLTALPLWYLAVQAFSEGLAEVVDELWRRRTLDLALRSVGLAVVVTGAALVVGIAGAFLVTRTDLPGRRVWRVVLALPLSLPSYVTAFAWISWRPSLAGFWGAALVLTSVSYPFVYLPVAAALRRLDATHEEVARSLGRTPTQVAFGLTLRQVRPAATAGALLVALYVLADFGAVATMRFESFTWVIYGAYRAGFNPTRAAVLSLVLVALSLVLVYGESKARGAGTAARVGGGAGRRPMTVHLGPLRWPALAVVARLRRRGARRPDRADPALDGPGRVDRHRHRRAPVGAGQHRRPGPGHHRSSPSWPRSPWPCSRPGSGGDGPRASSARPSWPTPCPAS